MKGQLSHKIRRGVRKLAEISLSSSDRSAHSGEGNHGLADPSCQRVTVKFHSKKTRGNSVLTCYTKWVCMSVKTGGPQHGGFSVDFKPPKNRSSKKPNKGIFHSAQGHARCQPETGLAVLAKAPTPPSAVRGVVQGTTQVGHSVED